MVQTYTVFWVDHELLTLSEAAEMPETTTVPAVTTSTSSETEAPSTALSTAETEQTTAGVTEIPQAQTTLVSTTESSKLTTTPFPIEVTTNIFTSTPSYSHVTRYNTIQDFHNLSNPTQGLTPYFSNNVTKGQMYKGLHNTLTSFNPEGNVTLATNITPMSVGDSTSIDNRSGNIREITNRTGRINSTVDDAKMLEMNMTDVQGQLENLTTASSVRPLILHTVTRTTRDVSKIELHGVTTVSVVPSHSSPNIDNTFLTSSPEQKTTTQNHEHQTEAQTVTTGEDYMITTTSTDIPVSTDLDSTTITPQESTEMSTHYTDQYLDTVTSTTVETDVTTVTDRSDTVTTTSIRSINRGSTEASTSTSRHRMLGAIPDRFPKPNTGKFDKDVRVRTDETTSRTTKALVSLPPVKTVIKGQQVYCRVES